MLADKVKQERPNAAADPGTSLCLIITDKDEIFSGVTGVRVIGESVETVCSETNAIMSMIVANQVNAKQMITISFADYRVCTPCDSCISLLYRASAANSSCQIVTSPDSFTTAEALRMGRASRQEPVHEEIKPETPDFLSDFDDETSELNAVPAFGRPAEFAASADPDESNPFYDAPAASADPGFFTGGTAAEPPKALYEQPSDAQRAGAAGFQNPYAQQQGYPMNGGYPQQQGYPMNGGYPQQQGYPMNGGYPQQQGYPMNGGYPQQQGYPMNGGYPQQQGYPMNGYPQQQGYPMNGGYQQNDPYSTANPAAAGQQNRSIHVTQGAMPVPQPNVTSRYQNRQGIASSNMTSGGTSAFKKRLNTFMSDGDDGDSGFTPSSGTPSMDELMKQAKDKKKVAKVNSDFKKKMKDLGY